MALADTVAYENQRYFTRGLKKQIEDLENMESIPEAFVIFSKSVVEAKSEGEIRNFIYSGELTVKDLKTIFKTSTQSNEWTIKNGSYKVIDNGFIESDLETNYKYIWVEINS